MTKAGGDQGASLGPESFIQVRREVYDEILLPVGPPIRNADGRLSVEMHAVRVDGNGRADFDRMVARVFEHLVSFVVKPSDHPREPDAVEWMRITQTARAAIPRSPTSGALGELILFFLLESYSGIPQLICKYPLKQSRRVEVLGSDGVHGRWSPQENLLDLYFGESKMYKDVGAGIKDGFASVKKFHDSHDDQTEIRLLMSHQKHGDKATVGALNDYLRRKPPKNYRINHAMMVGFDWDGFLLARQGDATIIEEAVKGELSAHNSKLAAVVAAEREGIGYPYLRFLVFLLPFESVEAARKHFLDLVEGRV